MRQWHANAITIFRLDRLSLHVRSLQAMHKVWPSTSRCSNEEEAAAPTPRCRIEDACLKRIHLTTSEQVPTLCDASVSTRGPVQEPSEVLVAAGLALHTWVSNHAKES